MTKPPNGNTAAGRYIIFYWPLENEAEIVRVLHLIRDLKRILRQA